MDTVGQFIFIELDEYFAGIYDTKPGWNLFNCAGEVELKRLFLEQELNETDKQAWCKSEITKQFREAVACIGGLERRV